MRFVDGIHQPVANLPVSQSWRNYSVESADHIDRGRTDSAGVVVFPIRSLWSPTLFRIVLPLTSFLNVHAPWGNDSIARVSGDRRTGPRRPRRKSKVSRRPRLAEVKKLGF